MSATEAARTFSQVLNRVSAGEEVRVIRNGAEVAVISPPTVQTVTAARFRDVIASAPAVDPAFVDDLESARASLAPPTGAWLS